MWPGVIRRAVVVKVVEQVEVVASKVNSFSSGSFNLESAGLS